MHKAHNRRGFALGSSGDDVCAPRANVGIIDSRNGSESAIPAPWRKRRRDSGRRSATLLRGKRQFHFESGLSVVLFDQADLAAMPSVDIANGAPTGADATDEIVDAWTDGSLGPDHEVTMVSYCRRRAFSR